MASGGALAAKPAWKPVSPAELAEQAPALAADAAAEVVFLNVDVDDRSFPHERKTTTYIRYKIFDPEKADAIARVTSVEATAAQDRVELHARLILPDGKIREFGKEAIKERPLVQKAKQEGFLGWLSAAPPVSKERFLAIAGIERGSIIEYYTVELDRWPSAVGVVTGQREREAVRRFEYRARLATDSEFLNRTFVSNLGSAEFKEDPKGRTVSVTATNLPAITLEPLSGPITDHVLTVFSCYERSTLYLLPRSGKVPLPDNVSGKAGPWTTYATVMNWVSRDRGFATKRVKALAADLTKSAKDEREKAKAIHAWIDRRWQAYRAHTPAKPRTNAARSLDDVIDWEKETDVAVASEDFLWLALSLYQNAGLTAHAVMLPNRELTRFNPAAASPVFLPTVAIALRSGEKWLFSSPSNVYSLPFDMLSWQQEGQYGLLALDQKQEFIPIGVAEPARSIQGTSATLELDAGGTLHGTFVRRLTGQLAVSLRGELRALPEAERLEHAQKKLAADLKAAEIAVTKIEGLSDPELPLDLTCTLKWPEFAARTRDRMMLRPMVFRAEATTPFTAEQRKTPIYFPHRWQEVDELKIRYPKGYQLESPSTPAAIPSDSLFYKVVLSVEDENQTLHVQRRFMSNVVAVSTEKYVPLRQFYDYVVRADQHELVLRRVAEVK